MTHVQYRVDGGMRVRFGSGGVSGPKSVGDCRQVCPGRPCDGVSDQHRRREPLEAGNQVEVDPSEVLPETHTRLLLTSAHNRPREHRDRHDQPQEDAAQDEHQKPAHD